MGRTREYCTLIFLSFVSCVVSSNPARDIYFCNYFKDFCFIFIKFSPFAKLFLHFN